MVFGTNGHSPRRHVTCVFEILMAALMLDLGVRLFLSPALLDQSHMRLILTTLSVPGLIMSWIVVGGLRVLVLIREALFGRYGIHVRIATSMLSCTLWSLMVFAFLEHFITTHAPLPPGFDMLATQVVGEFLVLYKLGTEA
jgi:hypothetical protein